MAFKTILADLSTVSGPTRTLDAALELATRFGAQLHGLKARRPWKVPLLPAMDDLLAAVAEGVTESAESERSFLAKCTERGIVGLWEESEDSRVPLVIRASQLADLVVVQQQEEAAPPDSNLDDLPGRLVLGSGSPVILVPRSETFSIRTERILVAWKPCREAARATREALPLLRSASAVTILTVGSTSDADGTFDGIGGLLARHGVKAEMKLLDLPDTSTADAILAEVEDLRCELLVMGAYGHWRLQELILGGVTKEIFRRATLPVFLSH